MATITTTLGERTIVVDVSQVVWFLAKDKYVEARMLDGRDILLPKATTIKRLQETYGDQFLQVSVAQTVATDCVRGLRVDPKGQGGHLYLNQDLPVRVTARFLNQVRAVVKALEASRELAAEPPEPVTPETWYTRGRKARQKGAGKVPPHGLDACSRSWWLAGWNDRDIEANLQRRNGPVY